MKTIPILAIIMAIVIGGLTTDQKSNHCYYINHNPNGYYIVDELGKEQAQVGFLTDVEDPEAFDEVLETQIGWPSIVSASEAYFLILED